jgi:hypothetical protein
LTIKFTLDTDCLGAITTAAAGGGNL